jgi:outer membrane lipoprotein SlyB
VSFKEIVMTYSTFFMVMMAVGIFITYAAFFGELAKIAVSGGLIAVLSLIGLSTPAHADGFGVSGYDISQNGKMRNEALSPGKALEGVVVHVRDVEVAPSGNSQMIGTTLGGVAGAVIGTQVGNGSGRYVASALSGVLGSFIGNAIASNASSAKAQEVIIKSKDGNVMVITQSDSNLSVGQPVYVISENSGKSRVIPE